jgi:hypothetical protein
MAKKTRHDIVREAQAKNHDARDEIINRIDHIRFLLTALETNANYFPQTERITAAVMDLRNVTARYVKRQTIK